MKSKYEEAFTAIASAPTPPTGTTSWQIIKRYPETLHGYTLLNVLKEIDERVVVSYLTSHSTVTASQLASRKRLAILVRAKHSKKGYEKTCENLAQEIANHRRRNPSLAEDEGVPHQVDGLLFKHRGSTSRRRYRDEEDDDEDEGYDGEDEEGELDAEGHGSWKERGHEEKLMRDVDTDTYYEVHDDDEGAGPASAHRMAAPRLCDPTAVREDKTNLDAAIRHVRLMGMGREGRRFTWTESEEFWFEDRRVPRTFYREFGLAPAQVSMVSSWIHRNVPDDWLGL